MGEAAVAICYACEQALRDDLPPRERVLQTSNWRVAHAFDTALPGWLVLLPNRHITSLAQLHIDEADEMGGLLRRLTTALQDELGCVKTYVVLLAEAEGFSHAHFHVIPRMHDLAEDLRGPRIFELMRRPAAQHVPTVEQDRLATALAARLAE